MSKLSLEEYHLSNFIAQNGHAQIEHVDDKFVIKNLWSEEEINLVVEVSDTEILELLNKIKIVPNYDAIFFIESNRIEFVLGFVLKEKLEIENHFSSRSFTLDFNKHSIKGQFKEPSEEFWSIAKIFKREPSAMPDAMRQMMPFTDYLKDDLPERLAKYFENRVPLNFHLENISISEEVDFEQLFRHINTLFHYYDRDSVLIMVRDDKISENEEKQKSLDLIEGHFPSRLSVTKIDDIILRLLETARESSVRMKFLYYYQVIEYSSHTYIDEKVKTKLRKQLRDPSIVSCTDDKISELFSTIIDLNHHDDVKIRKVVEDYIDPELLWKEISLNKDFFSKTISFDGGFNLNSIISESTDLASWQSMWHPKLIDSLTKIRNCIVHARERREDKVILPSHANNKKLAFFTLIIERIAESIALKHV